VKYHPDSETMQVTLQRNTTCLQDSDHIVTKKLIQLNIWYLCPSRIEEEKSVFELPSVLLKKRTERFRNKYNEYDYSRYDT